MTIFFTCDWFFQNLFFMSWVVSFLYLFLARKLGGAFWCLWSFVVSRFSDGNYLDKNE